MNYSYQRPCFLMSSAMVAVAVLMWPVRGWACGICLGDGASAGPFGWLLGIGAGLFVVFKVGSWLRARQHERRWRELAGSAQAPASPGAAPPAGGQS